MYLKSYITVKYLVINVPLWAAKFLTSVLTHSTTVLLYIDLRELPGKIQTVKGVLPQKSSC